MVILTTITKFNERQIPDIYVKEAPIDGKPYLRQDGDWVEPEEVDLSDLYTKDEVDTKVGAVQTGLDNHKLETTTAHGIPGQIDNKISAHNSSTDPSTHTDIRNSLANKLEITNIIQGNNMNITKVGNNATFNAVIPATTWDSITDKPATFPAATPLPTHNHAISDVTNLQTTLDAKAPSTHVGSKGTTQHAVVTTTAGDAGFMSAADKTKLDGIADGATANVGTITGITSTTPIVGSGTTGSVTLSHATQAIDIVANAGATPGFGGTVTVVGTAAGNGTGHVTAIKPTTITFPTETQLSGGSAATAGQYVSGVTVSNHAVTVSKGTLPVVPTNVGDFTNNVNYQTLTQVTNLITNAIGNLEYVKEVFYVDAAYLVANPGDPYVEGDLVFVRWDDSELVVNVLFDGIAIDFDTNTNELVINPGTPDEIRVDLSALIPVYQGYNGEHIQTGVNGNVIDAALKAGTIQKDRLTSAFQTEINQKQDAVIGKIITDSLQKITTDSQGHVTASTNVVATDLPDLPTSKITGLDTALSNASTHISNNTIHVTQTDKDNWNAKTTNTGTVTNVATGTGLTGGPVTTTGTISHQVKPASGTAEAGTGDFVASVVTDTLGHISSITKANQTQLSGGAAATINEYVSGVTVSGHAITVTKGTLPAVGGGGTVTNIATGTGLTGGPITGTGTISHQVKPVSGSDAGGTGDFVTGVSIDALGHIYQTTKGNQTAVSFTNGPAVAGQYISAASATGHSVTFTRATFPATATPNLLTINNATEGTVTFDGSAVKTVTIPTALKNPYTLTVTKGGAAYQTYDGSANVTVDIPTGGVASSVANPLTIIGASSTIEGNGKYTFDGSVAKTINFTSGNGLTMSMGSGTIQYSHSAHGGDVTGVINLTIGNNVVSNAKLAQMPTLTVKGNVTNATADPTDIPISTLKSELSIPTNISDLTNDSGFITAGDVNLDGFVKLESEEQQELNTILNFNSNNSIKIADLNVARHTIALSTTVEEAINNQHNLSGLRLYFDLAANIGFSGSDYNLIRGTNGENILRGDQLAGSVRLSTEIQQNWESLDGEDTKWIIYEDGNWLHEYIQIPYGWSLYIDSVDYSRVSADFINGIAIGNPTILFGDTNSRIAIRSGYDRIGAIVRGRGQEELAYLSDLDNVNATIIINRETPLLTDVTRNNDGFLDTLSISEEMVNWFMPLGSLFPGQDVSDRALGQDWEMTSDYLFDDFSGSTQSMTFDNGVELIIDGSSREIYFYYSGSSIDNYRYLYQNEGWVSYGVILTPEDPMAGYPIDGRLPEDWPMGGYVVTNNDLVGALIVNEWEKWNFYNGWVFSGYPMMPYTSVMIGNEQMPTVINAIGHPHGNVMAKKGEGHLVRLVDEEMYHEWLQPVYEAIPDVIVSKENPIKTSAVLNPCEDWLKDIVSIGELPYERFVNIAAIMPGTNVTGGVAMFNTLWYPSFTGEEGRLQFDNGASLVFGSDGTIYMEHWSGEMFYIHDGGSFVWNTFDFDDDWMQTNEPSFPLLGDYIVACNSLSKAVWDNMNDVINFAVPMQYDPETNEVIGRTAVAIGTEDMPLLLQSNSEGVYAESARNNGQGTVLVSTDLGEIYDTIDNMYAQKRFVPWSNPVTEVPDSYGEIQISADTGLVDMPNPLDNSTIFWFNPDEGMLNPTPLTIWFRTGGSVPPIDVQHGYENSLSIFIPAEGLNYEPNSMYEMTMMYGRISLLKLQQIQ